MKSTLKTLLSFFVVVLMLYSVAESESAMVSANNTVTLEGGELLQGRTLVPLRSIFEEIGAVVQWDQKNKKITATKDNRKITLTVGSKHTYVNGSHVIIDVPAQVKNGRTLVPLRFISESFGGTVKWEPANNRAMISGVGKEIIVHVNQPGTLQVKIDTTKNGIYVNGITVGATRQNVVSQLGQGKRKNDDLSGAELLSYAVNSNLGKREITYSMWHNNGAKVDAIYFDINHNVTTESWYKNLGKPFAKEHGVTYFYLESAEQLLMLKPNEKTAYLVHADNNFYYNFGLEHKMW